MIQGWTVLHQPQAAAQLFAEPESSRNDQEDTQMATVKEEAKRLIERLPDEASWDDLMYEIYVQKKIDMGLKAAEAGKLVPHEEAKQRLLRK